MLDFIAAAVPRQSSNCAPLELYHLAGTSEYGLGLVGNAYTTALPKAVPGATVHAIIYDTAPEYVLTVQQGAQTTQQTITARAAACPNTLFVLSGYSKGAMVVHATTLSADVQAKVTAVTVFGDPNKQNGPFAVPLNNNACFFSFCEKGDPFCDGGLNIQAHLAYGSDGSVTTASNDIASCYN